MLRFRNCVKIQFWKKVICHRIPIQTLQFLTALPTHQDGAESRDKASGHSFKAWLKPNLHKIRKTVIRLFPELAAQPISTTLIF